MTSAVRQTERPGGWIISLAFWLLLVTAAVLYALTALSPKLLVWIEERNEYRVNQVRLVALERQVRYLERVGHALENEPSFAAELARIDFDALRSGDERIAVAPDLTLARAAEPLPAAAAVLPWYAPLLRVFAENARVRTRMLIGAAGLVLIAFTFFNDPTCRRRRRSKSWPGSAWLRAVADRYRASAR